MTAINFPNSPTVNQIFTVGSQSWIFNGKGWIQRINMGIKGDTGPAGIDGSTPDITNYYTKTEIDSQLGDISSVLDAIETGTLKQPWERPSDWLPLPTLLSTDQKFVGLYAIFPDYNKLAFTCNAAYTVDWGDGTVQNFGNGVSANHTYSFTNAALDGTLCSRGYKQAIVTVTPQSGQNLTFIALNVSPVGVAKFGINLNWLDIDVYAPQMIGLVIGDAFFTFPFLERVIIERCNKSVLTDSFYACTALQVASVATDATVSNCTRMFIGCSNLVSVVLPNTSNCTNFTEMFNMCSSIESVPYFDTGSGTSFTNMFASCVSLSAVPFFNTSKSIDCSQMFVGCYSLQSTPLFDLGKVANLASMFSGCSSLESIPAFDTSSAIYIRYMFSSCVRIKSVPLLNMINCNDLSGMFSNCVLLQSVPLFNTSNGLYFQTMFSGCRQITSFPALDLHSASTTTNMFGNCSSLISGAVTGCTVSISYDSCSLSANAIVAIFTALGTANGTQTITITGNWGASLLTAPQRAIATGKGWTITG